MQVSTMYQFDQDEYGNFGGLISQSNDLGSTQIILQGIPYESGTSGKKGTSFAPSVLRLISKDMPTISRTGINLKNLRLTDVGNVPINSVDGEQTRNNITAATSYLLSHSSAPIISLGGDHSITFPILRALAAQGSVGVIWFDAHRDLMDSLNYSQYSHGTGLRRAVELPQISSENVLLIGTRYFTDEEEDFVHSQKISEIRRNDWETLSNPYTELQQRITNIAGRVDQMYFSLDIDGLDPANAPGTGTPVGGGFTTSELMRLLHIIPCPVRAFDIVEVSPPLDPTGITIRTMMGLLTEILAQIKETYRY